MSADDPLDNVSPYPRWVSLVGSMVAAGYLLLLASIPGCVMARNHDFKEEYAPGATANAAKTVESAIMPCTCAIVGALLVVVGEVRKVGQLLWAQEQRTLARAQIAEKRAAAQRRQVAEDRKANRLIDPNAEVG